MGPLVPDIVGNELNLVAAFFLGITFGFVLEQAGFSTSKKLVGLFYGYDFTVLRVFFTAGVTAMLGIIILGHYGLLDLSLIYINPTFIYSALAGGVIMGLGFVIGGFCPGTSICAAAIGKIDAMIFVLGSVFGVLLFAEGYPFFEGLYKAGNWGSPRIFDVLGMSQGLFAFLLTFVAIFAFYVTTLIENKVNRRRQSEFNPRLLYAAISAAAIMLGISAIFMPEKKTEMLAEASKAEYISNYKPKYMDSDELAFRLLDKDERIQLADLRPSFDYKRFALPGAINMTPENLFEKETRKNLSIKTKKHVFYAYEELTAIRAAKLAEDLGYRNIYVLKGGLKEFNEKILNFNNPGTAVTRQEADTYRFRERAKSELPVLIQNSKSKAVEKKQSKRIIGGC